MGRNRQRLDPLRCSLMGENLVLLKCELRGQNRKSGLAGHQVSSPSSSSSRWESRPLHSSYPALPLCLYPGWPWEEWDHPDGQSGHTLFYLYHQLPGWQEPLDLGVQACERLLCPQVTPRGPPRKLIASEPFQLRLLKYPLSSPSGWCLVRAGRSNRKSEWGPMWEVLETSPLPQISPTLCGHDFHPMDKMPTPPEPSLMMKVPRGGHIRTLLSL